MELKAIRRISFEKGIGINYVCKDYKLTDLLNKLHLLFRDEVILKGGTGLNRAYLGDKGRFSEDIDLDFINSDFRKAKAFIEKKMEKSGTLKSRLMHKTLRFDFLYVNEFGQKDRIRIEFYLGRDMLIGEAELKELASPITGAVNLFRTYSLESLIAMKLLTLLGRIDGKDIYDLYYCLQLAYDKKKVLKFTKSLCSFYEIQYKEFFDKLTERFGEFEKDYKNIGNSTNHCLTKENNLSWKFMIIGLREKLESINWH